MNRKQAQAWMQKYGPGPNTQGPARRGAGQFQGGKLAPRPKQPRRRPKKLPAPPIKTTWS